MDQHLLAYSQSNGSKEAGGAQVRTVADLSTESTTIAITATFTAEPLEQALAFWIQELEMPAHIAFAPYNQVFQQLLDPSSLLATNRNGINVVLVCFEDWLRDEPDAEAQALGKIDPSQTIKRNVWDLVQAVTAAVKRSPMSYLICLCPASSAVAANSEQAPLFKEMEDLIVSELAELNGVHVVTSQELAATYPIAEYYDSYADKLAHIPYTEVFFTALGTMIARKIHALRHAQYKVIVLDCDQTLWGGLCGEDGPLGIQISPEREAIQEFMIRQHDAGMLLCLCSKNNEEDVTEVFERRSEMVLKRDHITTWRVNWKPKSENIRSMAEELQLGLDSFIFIDDDPVECAEVQANCPEVLTLQLPQNPTTIPRFLSHLWIFDRLKVTAEGKERTALYKQAGQRKRFRKESFTFKDFLAGLRLRVDILPLSSHQLARVSELTQRTNQFNLTTIRRSEAEIQRLCRLGGAQCLVVQVKDRFGDYGLVGTVIFKADSEAIIVDTFLLSCRALGRGVEHRMLARLGEIARERGLERIEIAYRPTQKNRPARDFLEGIGTKFKEPLGNGFLFKFPVEFAVGVQYIPPVVEGGGELRVGQAASTSTSAGPDVDTRSKALLLSSIAEELYSAEQIQMVISAQTRTRPGTGSIIVEPRTQVEKKVADLYSELLGVQQVSIYDNFFDLGGHSLLAVQLLAQIEKVIGKHLPLATLFQAPTIEQLARILRQEGWSPPWSFLVPFQPSGSKPPFFCLHGTTDLVVHIGPDQPLFGLRAHGQDGRRAPSSVEEMASDYIKEIRAIQPEGPYFLGGYSFGGMVAFETAQQLLKQGQEVALLVLLDPFNPNNSRLSFPVAPISHNLLRSIKLFAVSLFKHMHNIILLKLKEKLVYVLERVQWRTNKIKKWAKLLVCRFYLNIGCRVPPILRMFYFFQVSQKAAKKYLPQAYQGHLTLLRSNRRARNGRSGWAELAAGGAELHEMPGNHLDVIREPHAQVWSKTLGDCLKKAQETMSGK